MSRKKDDYKERTPSQRDKILNSLREAGDKGLLNTQLAKISVRWSGRMGDLYRQGYVINVTHLGSGLCNYTLVKEPVGDLNEPPRALEVLINEIKEKHNGFITADELIDIINIKSLKIGYKVGFYKQSALSKSLQIS